MQRSRFHIIRRLTGMAGPLLPVMTGAVLMGVLSALCATFLAVFGAMALLSVMGFAGPFSTQAAMGLIVACAVLRAALRYGEQATNHYIAFRLLAMIRDQVFRAMRRLAPAKLEGRDQGDLVSLITSDVELLEVYYAHTISPVLIALVHGGIMTAFIGTYHIVLGALTAAALLIIGVLIPVVTYRMTGDSGQSMRAESGRMSTVYLDSLRGMDDCIQYGCGQEKLEEIRRNTRTLADLGRSIHRKTAWGGAAAGTTVWLGTLGMLAATIALYRNGGVNLSGLILPTVAVAGAFGPVLALSNLAANLTQTLAAGDRVLDILEETEAVSEVVEGSRPPFTGLNCQQVSFSYGRGPVLSQVNFEADRGCIIGVCGPSGSGKSTLLKLMMRFWEPSEGVIRIGGVPVNDINTGHLRAMQGLMTQETHLFHETVADNIRIADLSASQEQVEQACRKASIHDYIVSLPQGYQTPVGELGDRLSSGERQRIGLARAFLHNGPMLLLDEPTSNLDSLNEAVILKSLHRWRAKKTIVIVSHRRSTLAIADRVYTIEGGRIKEGAHT